MKFTDDFGPAYRPREATFIFPRTPLPQLSGNRQVTPSRPLHMKSVPVATRQKLVILTANVASLFQYRNRLGQIRPILTLEYREKGAVLDGAIQHNPLN